MPPATIDKVLDEYDRGFRKLDWAQKRPKCVFETGIGTTASIAHVQVARNVARIVVLKVRRELERGEFDAALRELDATVAAGSRPPTARRHDQSACMHGD